jgi:hypothetical protein
MHSPSSIVRDTAADVLLRVPEVNRYLGKLGISGIRVDRGEGPMARDYAGVADVPPASSWTLDWFYRAMTAVPRDQRDTATPAAVLKLLRMLVEGKALSKFRTTLRPHPLRRVEIERVH